jgi:hypothetical protein
MPIITIVANTGFFIEVRVIHMSYPSICRSFAGVMRRAGGPMRNRVQHGAGHRLV